MHFQDNKINSFEQELISNMPRLHHLNLSHNFLYDLKDETFEKNEELISLDISYNKFEYFSNLSFKGLEVLEVPSFLLILPPLFVHQCFITQVLNASHNAIKHIGNAIFTDLANLEVLDLSNNQITQLSDKLTDTTPLLKSIKLNDNLLQHIDDAVFTELELQHLDLSCNNLSSDAFLWPETISIAYLNLTFNAYTDINASLFDNIEIDLYGKTSAIKNNIKLPSTHIKLILSHFLQKILLHVSGLSRNFLSQRTFTMEEIMLFTRDMTCF